MPTHPFFGSYETVAGDTSCDFPPITVDGTDVEPMIIELGPPVTPELIDRFSEFCRDLETHVKTVRAVVREAHQDFVVPFVDDLIESNPQADILTALFPDEKDLISVAQLTPDMVARATSVTSCMTDTDPDDEQVTVDLTFRSEEMTYLIACAFEFDGTFIELDVES